MVTKWEFLIGIVFGGVLWEGITYLFTKKFDYSDILIATYWVGVTLLFLHYGWIIP